MNGVVFRYFSFSIDSCRRILGEHGFSVLRLHTDHGGNTCYVAQKSAATGSC